MNGNNRSNTVWIYRLDIGIVNVPFLLVSSLFDLFRV